ncbi:MAG: imidazole glycerol phosphate synthase subunit HisH [Gemmatimonadetes bacterium]|nr:imidazole glycerol phosphate synthase subunit HisH [Gemmatimonadota bacterium]NNL29802.1 imidazole glycerol phosphate synthase subunit HisH [Gemmatimonadota bacterium]
MTERPRNDGGDADLTLRVALFDYGAGNLHSLAKALDAAGASVTVTSDWSEALAADALVLPGVGAFGQAAAALPDDRGPIRTALEEGLPCLGICLGMQLFFERSDESDGHGIGLVAGEVLHVEADVVPHMGWNDVETEDDPLFDGIDGLVAYYANSYVCAPDDDGPIIARSTYGAGTFAAGVRRTNAWGVQFHPEKSSHQGRRIIGNFVREATRIATSARPGTRR